jgi:biopolymer transport protein ExbD
MRLPSSDESGERLHLTPLIDVVFLLLIFFLVATRFHEQEKLISVRLAEVFEPQPLASGPKEVVVNITRSGEFRVSDRTFSEAALMAFLARLSEKNPGLYTVNIRADQKVQFQYPLTVIGICRKEKLTYYCTVLERRAKT